jgi:hypothetical protein
MARTFDGWPPPDDEDADRDDESSTGSNGRDAQNPHHQRKLAVARVELPMDYLFQ